MNFNDLVKDLTDCDKDIIEVETYMYAIMDRIESIKHNHKLDDEEKEELIENCYETLEKIIDVIIEE